jgi:hypothetical protein
MLKKTLLQLFRRKLHPVRALIASVFAILESDGLDVRLPGHRKIGNSQLHLDQVLRAQARHGSRANMVNRQCGVSYRTSDLFSDLVELCRPCRIVPNDFDFHFLHSFTATSHNS